MMKFFWICQRSAQREGDNLLGLLELGICKRHDGQQRDLSAGPGGGALWLDHSLCAWGIKETYTKYLDWAWNPGMDKACSVPSNNSWSQGNTISFTIWSCGGMMITIHPVVWGRLAVLWWCLLSRYVSGRKSQVWGCLLAQVWRMEPSFLTISK